MKQIRFRMAEIRLKRFHVDLRLPEKRRRLPRMRTEMQGGCDAERFVEQIERAFLRVRRMRDVAEDEFEFADMRVELRGKIGQRPNRKIAGHDMQRSGLRVFFKPFVGFLLAEIINNHGDERSVKPPGFCKKLGGVRVGWQNGG